MIYKPFRQYVYSIFINAPIFSSVICFKNWIQPIAQRLGAAVTGEAIGGPFSSGTWHYGTGSEAFGVPKIAASVEDASEQVLMLFSIKNYEKVICESEGGL